MIPFLDLCAAYAEIEGDVREAMERVLASGRYLLGPELEAFEEEFAAYVGTRYAVGVGSGLDALVMSLQAFDIGPGDEVIVPAHTFIATWFAVSHVGARPVPVEPSVDTFNIDPDRIDAACSSRTRAIIPVHLYGCPAPMAAMQEIAERRGLRVLEDSAQAHGAGIGAQRVGSFGHAAAWSFYPGKNLGALGDGGAVTTNDADVACRVRLARNYGSSKKYVHERMGWNSRLDELQACVLRHKLRRLDAWNTRRQAVARTYHRELAHAAITLPKAAPESSVWHLYVIRSAQRDRLLNCLEARGVSALVHYPTPPHLQGAYEDLGIGPGELPLTEQLHQEVLSLPMGPHMSDEQVATVVRVVLESASDRG